MADIRIDDIPLEEGDSEFLQGVFLEPEGLERSRERKGVEQQKKRAKRAKRRGRKKGKSNDEAPESSD